MKGIQHFNPFAYLSRPAFEMHTWLITLLRLWSVHLDVLFLWGIQLGHVCPTDACRKWKKHSLKWNNTYLLLLVNCASSSQASFRCPVLPIGNIGHQKDVVFSNLNDSTTNSSLHPSSPGALAMWFALHSCTCHWQRDTRGSERLFNDVTKCQQQ